MKRNIIATAAGLALVGLAVAGALASQGGKVQPRAAHSEQMSETPVATPTAAPPSADTSTPAADVPAQPAPTSPGTDANAGCDANDVKDGETKDATPTAASTADPCNVQQEGQQGAKDQSSDPTNPSGTPDANNQDGSDQQGDHQDAGDAVGSD